jgi:hypothetical protein
LAEERRREKVMGRARCSENKEFAQAIKLFKKHEVALRKAEKSADEEQVEKILLSGMLCCEEAVVKLARAQWRHQKTCEECRKGK